MCASDCLWQRLKPSIRFPFVWVRPPKLRISIGGHNCNDNVRVIWNVDFGDFLSIQPFNGFRQWKNNVLPSPVLHIAHGFPLGKKGKLTFWSHLIMADICTSNDWVDHNLGRKYKKLTALTFLDIQHQDRAKKPADRKSNPPLPAVVLLLSLSVVYLGPRGELKEGVEPAKVLKKSYPLQQTLASWHSVFDKPVRADTGSCDMDFLRYLAQ